MARGILGRQGARQGETQHIPCKHCFTVWHLEQQQKFTTASKNQGRRDKELQQRRDTALKSNTTKNSRSEKT